MPINIKRNVQPSVIQQSLLQVEIAGAPIDFDMLLLGDRRAAAGAARSGKPCQVRTFRGSQRVGTLQQIAAARSEVFPVAANRSYDNSVTGRKFRRAQFRL